MSTPSNPITDAQYGLFVFSSAVVGVLIIVWAFFSSAVQGFFVSRLLGMFVKKLGARISIDSVNLAPLSGTIVFKGFVYTTPDYCFRAVDGFIRIRWWLQHIKRSFDDTSPCRVEFEVNGLDVQIFNNSSRYEQIRSILAQKAKKNAESDTLKTNQTSNQTSDNNDDEVIDLKEILNVADYQPGFFSRFSPVVKAVIHRGGILLGNPLLEPLLIMAFHNASIKYTNEQATYPQRDYYKTRIKAELTHVNCKIIDNPCYEDPYFMNTSTNEQFIKPTSKILNEEDKDCPTGGLKRFLDRFDYKFLQNEFEKAEDKEDDKKLQMNGILQDSEKERKPKKWKGLKRYAANQDRHMLSFAVLSIDYYADSPGPLLGKAKKDPTNETKDLSQSQNEKADQNEDTYPKNETRFFEDADLDLEDIERPLWGINIISNENSVIYGPKHNRYRNALQNFFMPALPPNENPPPKLRQYRSFDIDYEMIDGVTLRVPFQSPNTQNIPKQEMTDSQTRKESKHKKSNHSSQASNESNFEYLELQCGSANVHYKLPSVYTEPNSIDIQFNPVSQDGVSPSDDLNSSESIDPDSSDYQKMKTIKKNHLVDSSSYDQKAGSNAVNSIKSYLSIFSSLHQQPFLKSGTLSVDLNILYSESAESPAIWNTKLKLRDSSTFLIREHMDLFTRLSADFGQPASQFSPSTYSEQLASFKPTIYQITANFENEFSVYLNTNENNIIRDLTDLKSNAFYHLAGNELDATINLPLTDYQAARTKTDFKLFTKNLSINAIHPTTSTIFQLENKDRETLSFITAAKLQLTGSLDLAGRSDSIIEALFLLSEDEKVETDYLDLNIMASDVTMMANGAHLNMFMRFKDNFLGAFTKSSKPKDKRTNSTTLNKKEEAEFHQMHIGAQDKDANPEKILENPLQQERTKKMEVNMNVEIRNPTVELPLNLYNCSSLASASCKRLLVSLRVGSDFVLSVQVSPTSIAMPPTANSSIIKKPLIFVKHFSLEMIFRYATISSTDPISGATSKIQVDYRDTIKVKLGEIHLTAEPLQVLSMLDGVQQLFYNIYNHDNRLNPAPTVKKQDDLLRHTTIFLSIASVSGLIWTPGGVIRIIVANGLKLATDSLFTSKFGKYLRLRVPNGRILILTPISHAKRPNRPYLPPITVPELEDWVESASFHLPQFLLRHVDKFRDPESSQLHLKQLEFLREADKSRHQTLPYLWGQNDEIREDPTKRYWLKDFFDSEPEVVLHSTLTSRLFNKQKVQPTSKSSVTNETPANTPDTGIPQSTSTPPVPSSLDASQPSKPSILRIKLNQSGSSSFLRSSNRKTSFAIPEAVLRNRRDTVTSEMTSEEFLTARSDSSSDDDEYQDGETSSTVADSLEQMADEEHPSSGRERPKSPQFESKPKKLFQTALLPVNALLDHHSFDSYDESGYANAGDDEVFTGTFLLSCASPVRLADDNFGTPETLTQFSEQNDFPDSKKSQNTSNTNSQNPPADKIESLAADSFLKSTPLLPKTKVERSHGRTRADTIHSLSEQKLGGRVSHNRVKTDFVTAPGPSTKNLHASQTQSHMRAETSNKGHFDNSFLVHSVIELPTEQKHEVWSSETIGTLMIDIKDPIDVHATPESLNVLSLVLDSLSSECTSVETLLDRLQLKLTSQMMVSTDEAGMIKFDAVSINISQVRVCLLQSHLGLTTTSFITSLMLKGIKFTMKSEKILTAPAVYANEKHHLPALIEDVRSKDKSFTLESASLVCEQLHEDYAKDLAQTQQDLHDSFDSTEKLNSRPTPNSMVIFSAHLIAPIRFLNRLISTPQSSTIEVATSVNTGKVIGAVKEQFGACLSSLVRAWSPPISVLASSATNLSCNTKFSLLVLFELLVQLRDVDVMHFPYDAFGSHSEAHRSTWMLIYITRQRLMASKARPNSEHRLVAGHVHNTTLVSYESLQTSDKLSSLEPRQLPRLLLDCVELDSFLNFILSDDPDILGTHFLGSDSFLKKTQVTRERFDVLISGMSIKLPIDEATGDKNMDLVRTELTLLPLVVSALTKTSVRLPHHYRTVRFTSSNSKQTKSPLTDSKSDSLPKVRRNKFSIVSDDVNASSSDPIGSGSNSKNTWRILSPIVIKETQFLVNSKGVKIHIVPRVLSLVDNFVRSWRTSDPNSCVPSGPFSDYYNIPTKNAKRDPIERSQSSEPNKYLRNFRLKFSTTSAMLPSRLTLLEQAVGVSRDLLQYSVNDKHAISGHLVSDAFALRAASKHGTVALDIPETTLTLSALPQSSSGHRPASYSVILRLPTLLFAAVIDSRKRLAPSSAELNTAPISIELSQLAACVVFTPSGISIIEINGKKQESRSHHSRSSSSSPSDSIFDALDIVIRLKSAILPFKIPNPVYSQDFLKEWYVREPLPPKVDVSEFLQKSEEKTTNPTLDKSSQNNLNKTSTRHMRDSSKHFEVEQTTDTRKKQRQTSSQEQGKNNDGKTLTIFSRKIRATLHAHMQNISVVMNQLSFLPVQYEVPEFVFMSRHAEHEHALHVSVKSHSVSFDPRSVPKEAAEALADDGLQFVSSKPAVIVLPPWTLEATVRQVEVKPSAENESLREELRAQRHLDKEEGILRTDIDSRLVVHHVQNILKPNVLKNILVFQSTMTREFESILAVIEEANNLKHKEARPTDSKESINDEGETNNNNKTNANKKKISVFGMISPLVRWRLNLDWKGIEMQLSSPHATVILYSGHFRSTITNVKISATKQSVKQQKRQEKTRVQLDQPASSITQLDNPFNVELRVNNFAIVLCPPNTKAHLYQRQKDCIETSKIVLWGGFVTNVCVQTFASDQFNFDYNIKHPKGPFESLWVSIDGTHALIQPWVAEKALLMWLFFSEYHQKLVQRRRVNVTPTTEKKESPPSEQPTLLLEGTNVSLFMKISTIGVLVPCNTIKLSPSLKSSKSFDPNFKMNTALVLRLESFTLSGSTRSSKQAKSFEEPKHPKKTQLLANSVIKGLVGGFATLDYENQVIALENDKLYKPSEMNHAIIAESDCQFIFVKEAKLASAGKNNSKGSNGGMYERSNVRGAVELQTSGLVLKLNAQLYSHVSILLKNVEYGRLRFTNIIDELNKDHQNQMKSALSRPKLSLTSRESKLFNSSKANLTNNQGNFSSPQATFEMDIRLVTKAGAVEFYSTTSVSKADTSGSRAKKQKAQDILQQASKIEDPSDSISTAGSVKLEKAALKNVENPDPQKSTLTLLVSIPLPQTECTFHNNYISTNNFPNSSNAGPISSTRNEQVLSVVIAPVNCTISPDFVIFYHELLTQMAVVTRVFDELELDFSVEKESSDSKFTGNLSSASFPQLPAFMSPNNDSKPDDANEKSKLSSLVDRNSIWTIKFQIHPSSLSLTSSPYSETVCSFKLGNLILLYQSGVVTSTTASMKWDQPFQRSVMFHLDSLQLNVEHPHFDKENNLADLRIDCLRLHGSHTDLSIPTDEIKDAIPIKSDPSQTNPLTVFITVKSSVGFFSVRHMHEILLFLNVWKQGIYLSQFSDFFGNQANEAPTTDGEQDDSINFASSIDTPKDVDIRPDPNIGLLSFLLSESSILLNCEINSIAFVTDLGPSISSVSLTAESVIGSLSVPGRNKIDPLGEIFDVVVQSGDIRLTFKGALEGQMEILPATLHGQRVLSPSPIQPPKPHKPSTLKRPMTIEPPKPTLVGRNIWSIDLLPISMNLNYSLSPMLYAKTGTISAKARDSWGQREDIQDKSESTEDLHSLSTVALPIWDPTMVVELALDTIDLQISSETISMPLAVAKRLVENIKNSYAKSINQLKSMDQLLLVRRELNKMRHKAGIGVRPLERLAHLRNLSSAAYLGKSHDTRANMQSSQNFKSSPDIMKTGRSGTKSKSAKEPKIAIGQVKIVGSALNFRVFGYSLRDPGWFELNISSYQIALDQQAQWTSTSASQNSLSDSINESAENEEIVSSVSRELALVLGSATLKKCLENRRSQVETLVSPWKQTLQSENMFVIPATTLIEYTIQESGNINHDVYFVTQFANAIKVSIKLGLYTELKDLVSIYQRVLEPSKGTGLITRQVPENSTPLKTHRKKKSSTGEALTLDPNGQKITQSFKKGSKMIITSTQASAEQAKESSSSQAQKKATKPKETFTIKKFDFNPSIDVLGDFTPKVATVLGWLGINDGEQSIPTAVHKLTDVLEVVLENVDSMSNLIRKQRQVWKQDQITPQ